MGRPKKTLNDLPAGWKEQILAEMSEGAAVEEIKGMLRISDDLYERWMEEEPDFSRTIKEGKQLSQQWWMGKGRKNMENKQFNAVLWYMNMKNRFGWKDKHEFAEDPDNPFRFLDVRKENEKKGD